MTIVSETTPDRNHPQPTSIEYNRHTHMFDVLYCGEKIAEESCYGDGEASLLIYIALREADEVAADEAYRRTVAARHILRTYPGAAFIGHREATRIHATLTQPYIVTTLPDGYAVHHVLLGTFGALIERVRFGEVM